MEGLPVCSLSIRSNDNLEVVAKRPMRLSAMFCTSGVQPAVITLTFLFNSKRPCWGVIWLGNGTRLYSFTVSFESLHPGAMNNRDKRKKEIPFFMIRNVC